MAEKSSKKNGSGTTLDLMGDEEAQAPRPARKAAAPTPSVEPAPVIVSEADGALFGGEDVDLEARHPADVPVSGFPAPSQIALVAEPQPMEADPFGEEDPFEDSVMARMLADEPAPLLSPLRAAREDLNEASNAVAEPDLEAFADPVAVPEVEQVVDFAVEPVILEAVTVEAAPEPEAVQQIALEQETILEMEAPMPVAAAAPETKPAETKPPKITPAKAAKTNAPGLTFTRRYTQPGQDVWETTEWELRNASIVGSDGTVVFEQKGVEIPKVLVSACH